MADKELSLEYSGRRVRFIEYSDSWRCDDYGIEESTLSKLKARIDEIDREARRVDAAVIVLRPDHRAEPIDGKATVIAGKGRSATVFYTPATARMPIRRVANLDELAPATSEAREAIRVWKAALETLQTARSSAESAFKAIPRVTREYLQESAEAKS